MQHLDIILIHLHKELIALRPTLKLNTVHNRRLVGYDGVSQTPVVHDGWFDKSPKIQ